MAHTNLSTNNLNKDEIKTEFNSHEGTYKISALINNLEKINTNQCLNQPIKITLISRIKKINSYCSSITNNNMIDENENIIQTDILVFNIGRELIIYEFIEPTQPNFSEPIDHRIYKQNHQPTCHDITQYNNILHVIVGFSKGQIQYINMETKEQKIFNEENYLDKTKVTCIKWLLNPQTYFLVSYSSGYLYVFDQQLNHLHDNINIHSISYTKNEVKQERNPIARWSIGSGSINEFSFSPDNTLLAVVSQDGFLRIFNYEKMELVIYMKSYFAGLLCVCWSPDGKYIATGGEDDFLTLFSINYEDYTSRVICRGYGHTSWISSISFDPYMNAKTYYSSLSNNNSSYIDTTIPSLFYRICTVGQDNRLCLWNITEDILKITSSSLLSINSQQSITKISLSSRLSFIRNSNKIKKSRKFSLLSIGTKSDNSKQDLSLSSQRINIDLTKTIFGTNLCPKLNDIQIIEPIIAELISHERLNSIYFSKNYFLTSSQDGIISLWEKPTKKFIERSN